MPEITKVQITIRKFLFETREAVRDPQKAIEWLRSFRETLEFQDLVDRPNAYAIAVIEEARNFNDVQRKNSQMKQVKRALEQDGVKNPTRSQMEYKWRAMYLSADAPTREDGEFKSDSGDAGNLESATSATHYGVASHREAEDVSATDSNISSEKDGSRQSRRTDGHSLRVGNVARPPVRSSGPMPADVQKVYDFASLEGLDKDDAYECWYVTVNERGGRTSDGKKVTNWKAYVRSWCRTRSKRRSA